jgi:hypothetical protein
MKTLTKLTLLTLLPLITSCEKKDRTMHDMCLQRKIFKECMDSLPAGPTTAHYNDWDEVVKECGTIAYHHSTRRESTIKNECKGDSY